MPQLIRRRATAPRAISCRYPERTSFRNARATSSEFRIPREESVKRKYAVDVDIGGTLTDGLVSDGEEARSVKVDTTPHDFTVCLFECLKEAGRRVGFEELAAFLEQVTVIRWSTTIATNVLAERKGPRIGLLV